VCERRRYVGGLLWTQTRRNYGRRGFIPFSKPSGLSGEMA